MILFLSVHTILSSLIQPTHGPRFFVPILCSSCYYKSVDYRTCCLPTTWCSCDLIWCSGNTRLRDCLYNSQTFASPCLRHSVLGAMPRTPRLEDVTCVVCMDTLFNKRDDLDEILPIATADCGKSCHRNLLLSI